MVTHVVCFRFSDFAHAVEARRRLLLLPGAIATLRGLEAGLDTTRSERSYDLALITRFDDLAGLDAYRVHPVHQEVAAFIREAGAQSVAVDFVDEASGR